MRQRGGTIRDHPGPLGEPTSILRKGSHASDATRETTAGHEGRDLGTELERKELASREEIPAWAPASQARTQKTRKIAESGKVKLVQKRNPSGKKSKGALVEPLEETTSGKICQMTQL